jgi:hypothetical protein
LSTAYCDLAGGLAELGRQTEALEAYSECVDLEIELGSKDSKSPPDLALLRAGLLGVARCDLRLGRVREASAAVERLASLANVDPEALVAIARELTRCSVDVKDRIEEAWYADRAMELLRRAVGAGYRNLEALRTESTFDPLRTRAEFDDLLTDAAFPHEPFAR